jgi:hypothetical protein
MSTTKTARPYFRLSGAELIEKITSGDKVAVTEASFRKSTKVRAAVRNQATPVQPVVEIVVEQPTLPVAETPKAAKPKATAKKATAKAPKAAKKAADPFKKLAGEYANRVAGGPCGTKLADGTTNVGDWFRAYKRHLKVVAAYRAEQAA